MSSNGNMSGTMHGRFDAPIPALPSRGTLSLWHAAALGTIALVLLAGAMAVGFYSTSSVDMTRIVDTAGRQRMLSQRVALYAHMLASGDSQAERDAGHKGLEQALAMMEKEHDFISVQHGMDGHERPFGEVQDSSSIRAMYLSTPLEIDRHVHKFFTHAHALASLPVPGVTTNNPDYRTIEQMATGDLLEKLDMIAKEYGIENARHVRNVPFYAYAIFGFSFMVLLFEMMCIFRPMIAAIEKAYEHLKDISNSKSEFLATMSHEIRTPINAIMGIGELLQESNLTNKQQGQIKTLLTATDNLLLIIDDILDLSKVESGRLELEDVPFDLNAAAEDAVEMLAVKARAKRLEVIVHYLPGTPQFVVGDPGRVRQIIANLVSNAVKFTAMGYVLITIDKGPQDTAQPGMVSLRVRVEDTGVGIPREKQVRIFERFMQADSTTVKKFGGTGLGLSICRQLVALMHGEIGVESEIGKGSVFWFTMQLATSERNHRLPTTHGILKGKRVMVIDDMAVNLSLLSDAFTAAGAYVRTCSNPLDGLRELREAAVEGHSYDFAILDYLMPDMDGETLARSIRHDAHLQELPLMMLSSVSDKDFVKIFADMGVAAYLNKPARKSLLLDTAAAILDSRQRGEPADLFTSHTIGAMRAQAESDGGPRLEGVRILLAEDNHVNREFTTEMLQNMGCIVDTAENGIVAVEKSKGYRYDIILMDCLMPDMDGFEATRRINALHKERSDLMETPIIALTANAMEKDREECLGCGMHDYLSKPVRRANLEAMLLRWVKRRMPPEVPALVSAKMENVMDMNAKSNGQKVPAPAGIDAALFSEARELVGGKFDALINYYLDDSQRHLQKIQRAMKGEIPLSDMTMSAHTLKSSSKHFGFTGLSDCAQQIEALSRSLKAANSNNPSKELDQAFRQASAAYHEIRKYIASIRAA